MTLALAPATEQTRTKQSATFGSTRLVPLTLLLTTSRTSMVASAALGGLPKTLTNVTHIARAVVYHGLQMTRKLGTRLWLPVVACRSKELHKATPTVKTSVDPIPTASAMGAQTADGAGLQTPATSGYQPKLRAGASQMTLSTTLVAIADRTTTFSAVPTALAVTGPGLWTILLSGAQPMLAADARPRISRK